MFATLKMIKLQMKLQRDEEVTSSAENDKVNVNNNNNNNNKNKQKQTNLIKSPFPKHATYTLLTGRVHAL